MPELKVTQQHLDHDAYLYIRQSTPRQVLENTESTQRQYALRDRAVALGWPLERIHVLDCDLGQEASRREIDSFRLVKGRLFGPRFDHWEQRRISRGSEERQ